MFFKSAKINEFRLWGLFFTLFGMGIMILGTAGIVLWGGQAAKVVAGIFMVFGLISMLVSMAIYFWAGMLSTSAVMLECPECHKPTKMLGKTDRCMFCKTMLTLDPDKATHAADGANGQAT
ncbi:hypothetical protein BG53_08840 [Paenibacillus darwinianus]|uniref:Zinc-ribbon containing domain-containing protein n=1 Tax=Paenibacillus darwinianus TaxID=1380763 RepID=A0A9W5RZ37_9BACL|nr:YgzB family protein [Paenibacillus darwinianus]EXX85304.1 hypothetical protein BG53_08840 [Paenibacillus darwinianus]EXX86144.1 hypothetical protein CH50_07885 [Paenibacillus darwinianus]EXX86312.1 hypothetical protein BG52_06800 [Paenibacillus darwinianus]